MPDLKVGIVGLGFMGATHLDAYRNSPDVRVAAICSSNPAALSGDFSKVGGNLGRDFGTHDLSSVRKYSQWRDLINDSDLDIVDLCVPTDMHAPLAVAALAAAKHVLCEKPMALTVSDCSRMLAAAREHMRVLMVAQVLRFWPVYDALRQFVQSGAHGAILSATFIRRCGLPDWSCWLVDEGRSGGAVIDLLIHDIDQALSLFGTPSRVAAKQLGELDGVTATLMYPNGPDVRVQGGWFAPGAAFSMSFQVRAERAELELSAKGLMLNDAAGRRTEWDVSGTDPYQAEAAYFVHCCREGIPPERCLPEDSARALRVALLIKESRARGGEQVPC